MDATSIRSTMKGIRNTFGRWFPAAVAAALIASQPGCGGESPLDQAPPVSEEVRSEKARKTSLSASDVKLGDLVRGNSAFAFDLYHALREREGNLFYSPHSISVALAMTYTGARGETARQMKEVLNYSLSPDQLHPAFNVLDLELASRGKTSNGQDSAPVRLNIANAIWGQKEYPFLPQFLDALAENYGAGMRTVDFIKNPEVSRTAINDWVADQTEERIRDLIPEGAIDVLTRLVLSNAIYFNAAWHLPFDEKRTSTDSFHLLSGDRVDVPMMQQDEVFNFAWHEAYQAQVVELLYRGREISMIILLPAEGEFERFESLLTSDLVSEILNGMSPDRLRLSIPSFELESGFELSQTLAGMGMPDAFNSKLADFSGMIEKNDENDDLYCSAVVHKAFVKVNERGTEAAAATGVVMGIESAMPTFKANRPFIFLIRDIPTNAILFVGRMLDPEK